MISELLFIHKKETSNFLHRKYISTYVIPVVSSEKSKRAITEFLHMHGYNLHSTTLTARLEKLGYRI